MYGHNKLQSKRKLHTGHNYASVRFFDLHLERQLWMSGCEIRTPTPISMGRSCKLYACVRMHACVHGVCDFCGCMSANLTRLTRGKSNSRVTSPINQSSSGISAVWTTIISPFERLQTKELHTDEIFILEIDKTTARLACCIGTATHCKVR